MAEWKTYLSLSRPLLERIEDYADRLGVPRSAAISFLISRGLDAEAGRFDPTLTINHIADAHITEED